MLNYKLFRRRWRSILKTNWHRRGSLTSHKNWSAQSPEANVLWTHTDSLTHTVLICKTVITDQNFAHWIFNYIKLSALQLVGGKCTTDNVNGTEVTANLLAFLRNSETQREISGIFLHDDLKLYDIMHQKMLLIYTNNIHYCSALWIGIWTSNKDLLRWLEAADIKF